MDITLTQAYIIGTIVGLVIGALFGYFVVCVRLAYQAYDADEDAKRKQDKPAKVVPIDRTKQQNKQREYVIMRWADGHEDKIDIER